MKNIYKILIPIIIFCLFVNPVFAVNTKSHDLEYDNSQSLSITDASQTGLDLSTTFTIEGWTKPETLGGDIIAKALGTGNQKSYRIQSAGGKLVLYVTGDGTDGNADLWSTDDVVLTTGTWVYFAITFNAGTPLGTWYINGSAVATTKTYDGGFSSPVYNGTANFYIGAREAGASAIYDGLVDEVIIWNDVRTPTEISESYNSGNGKVYNGDEAGMVAYWRFEDDNLDTTANDNDLTFNTTGGSEVYSTDVPFVDSSPAIETKRIKIPPQIIIY